MNFNTFCIFALLCLGTVLIFAGCEPVKPIPSNHNELTAEQYKELDQWLEANPHAQILVTAATEDGSICVCEMKSIKKQANKMVKNQERDRFLVKYTLDVD